MAAAAAAALGTYLAANSAAAGRASRSSNGLVDAWDESAVSAVEPIDSKKSAIVAGRW